MEQKWISQVEPLPNAILEELLSVLPINPTEQILFVEKTLSYLNLQVLQMVSFWSKSSRMSVWSFITKNNRTRSF